MGKKVHLVNHCDAPVLLRDFIQADSPHDRSGDHTVYRPTAMRKTGATECSVDGTPDRSCVSLAQGDELWYTIPGTPDDKSTAESPKFAFSWDEAKQLGYQLQCSDYTFCQGLEIQNSGTSLNFDNQRGYSVPIGVAFLDAQGRALCPSPQGGQTTCGFDTRKCKDDRTIRVFDPYGSSLAKGYSYEYCVSPDNNRACISSLKRDPSDNPRTPAQCAKPEDISCSVPSSNCNGVWCSPRQDVWANVDASATKRSSSALNKILVQKDEGGVWRPTREQFLADFFAGGLQFQEEVNLACRQGATYNYTGSLVTQRELGYPEQPNIRVNNSAAEGAGFAISYECDGTQQYIPNAWLTAHGYDPAKGQSVAQWLASSRETPPARLDMAANVGLKCEEHETIEVQFCPGGGGPARDRDAEVESYLTTVRPGLKSCDTFPGFSKEDNWGGCGENNQGGQWACALPKDDAGAYRWQCNVGDPFKDIQQGGGCAAGGEFCKWPGASPSPPSPPAKTCGTSCLDQLSCKSHIAWEVNTQGKTCQEALAIVAADCQHLDGSCSGCSAKLDCPEAPPAPAPAPASPPCCHDFATFEDARTKYCGDNGHKPTACAAATPGEYWQCQTDHCAPDLTLCRWDC